MQHKLLHCGQLPRTALLRLSQRSVLLYASITDVIQKGFLHQVDYTGRLNFRFLVQLGFLYQSIIFFSFLITYPKKISDIFAKALQYSAIFCAQFLSYSRHLLETSIFIRARNTYFSRICNFPVCAINLLQNLHFCFKNTQLSNPDGYILPYVNKA